MAQGIEINGFGQSNNIETCRFLMFYSSLILNIIIYPIILTKFLIFSATAIKCA